MGYPSDLTDAEWELIEAYFRPNPLGGRPPDHARRIVLNAIFYVDRTGCQWRYLPSDFPHWNTVYTQFRRWKLNGTWVELNDVLRRKVRVQEGRDEEPSAAIIDSQSVKTTEKGGLPSATMAIRRSRDGSATFS